MNAAAAQWIGCRDHQEDAYKVKHFPEGALAIVCDGMGGHSCGDMAAKTAVEAFVDAFAATPRRGDIPACLQIALDAANEAVGHIFDGTSLYGGCTLVAMFVSGSLLWWVSVGDSALMIWRGTHLLRLNADHSMRSVYDNFMRSGAVSFKEAMSQGHMLRSAITGEKIPLVDLPTRAHILLPGDRLILASDGVEPLLFPPVLSEDARQALSTPFENSAVAIIEACHALGDPCADNTTVIVLDI